MSIKEEAYWHSIFVPHSGILPTQWCRQVLWWLRRSCGKVAQCHNVTSAGGGIGLLLFELGKTFGPATVSLSSCSGETGWLQDTKTAKTGGRKGGFVILLLPCFFSFGSSASRGGREVGWWWDHKAAETWGEEGTLSATMLVLLLLLPLLPSQLSLTRHIFPVWHPGSRPYSLAAFHRFLSEIIFLVGTPLYVWNPRSMANFHFG